MGSSQSDSEKGQVRGKMPGKCEFPSCGDERALREGLPCGSGGHGCNWMHWVRGGGELTFDSARYKAKYLTDFL